MTGINVLQNAEGWNNYRIPDLTFVAAGSEHILHEDGVRAAAPDAVIDIRSPGDDTYEKLPFYAEIGTREVVIVDRNTRETGIHRLVAGAFVMVGPDADGWLLAETMAVKFQRLDTQPPRLRIEDTIDSAACTEI